MTKEHLKTYSLTFKHLQQAWPTIHFILGQSLSQEHQMLESTLNHPQPLHSEATTLQSCPDLLQTLLGDRSSAPPIVQGMGLDGLPSSKLQFKYLSGLKIFTSESREWREYIKRHFNSLSLCWECSCMCGVSLFISRKTTYCLFTYTAHDMKEVYYFNNLQKELPVHALDYPVCIMQAVHELDNFSSLSWFKGLSSLPRQFKFTFSNSAKDVISQKA